MEVELHSRRYRVDGNLEKSLATFLAIELRFMLLMNINVAPIEHQTLKNKWRNYTRMGRPVAYRGLRPMCALILFRTFLMLTRFQAVGGKDVKPPRRSEC